MQDIKRVGYFSWQILVTVARTIRVKMQNYGVHEKRSKAQGMHKHTQSESLMSTVLWLSWQYSFMNYRSTETDAKGAERAKAIKKNVPFKLVEHAAQWCSQDYMYMRDTTKTKGIGVVTTYVYLGNACTNINVSS